jgi:uncharacterized membrane protein YeaQ/YmgE (transglycosylase-associated protein family)
MEIVYFLLIGAVAGWLAGQLMKGRGFGLAGNMVVGVIGSLLGGTLFRSFGLMPDGSLISVLITALVGALVLLVLVGVIKKA